MYTKNEKKKNVFGLEQTNLNSISFKSVLIFYQKGPSKLCILYSLQDKFSMLFAVINAVVLVL